MPGILITSPPVQPPAARVYNGSESRTGTRQAGTLVQSEVWWRDRYRDIEKHGYKLRPRYDPLWEPSWIESKKDFYKVEDGQANIVRLSCSLLKFLAQLVAKDESCDGRHACPRWPASYAQEGTP